MQSRQKTVRQGIPKSTPSVVPGAEEDQSPGAASQSIDAQDNVAAPLSDHPVVCEKRQDTQSLTIAARHDQHRPGYNPGKHSVTSPTGPGMLKAARPMLFIDAPFAGGVQIKYFYLAWLSGLIQFDNRTVMSDNCFYERC
jgi:hypothetical protein